MARPPLQPIRGTAQLNPVASPVDAYVAPGKNRLLDFAESLQRISPALNEFISQRAEKQAKDDFARGQAAEYAGVEDGFAEGVRTGQIPPQFSPAYVRGRKLAMGSVAGGNLREKFALEYDAWEGKNSDDPAAFDTFYQDFLKRNLDPNADPEVLAGVLPSVKELEVNGRSRHIEYTAKRMFDSDTDTTMAGVAQDVDAASEAGLADEKGTDYNAVFKNIFTRRSQFIAKGRSEDDFDKPIMQAMSLKILETRDPGLLAFFDQKVPGKNYTYGETLEGQKIKAATINSLETIVRQSEVEEAQKLTKANKAAEDEAIQQTMRLLEANPGAPIPDGLMQSATKVIPDYQAKVAGWRESLNKGFTDNDKLKRVYDDVLAGKGMQAVTDAWSQGVFGRIEDLNAARAFAESWQDNRSKIEDAVSSSTAKDFLTTLERRTKSANDMGEFLPGLSNEGFEAQYDFKRMLTDWVIRNPDKATNLTERETAINEIGKKILDRIPENDGMEASPYERPAEMDFANPFTDGTGVQQTEGQTPEDTSATDGSTPAEQQAFLDQMIPEQRAAFKAAAEARGITEQEQAKQVLSKQPALKPIVYDPNDQDPGEGDQREGGLTPELATQFLDQAFTEQGSPTASGQEQDLKKLILQHEAGGNYNAVYGNSRSKVDLSKYSLDDILARQQRARRKGAASTAIGGYQFIYKTLRNLKRQMGLTGNEKFTPELQDQMADVLLEGRGLSRFRAGKMSKRAFALGLAQEWASLPNPNTGRSYYAGDGLNASSAKVRDVYAALGFGVEAPAETSAKVRNGPSFKEAMGIDLRPATKSYAERSKKPKAKQKQQEPRQRGK